MSHKGLLHNVITAQPRYWIGGSLSTLLLLGQAFHLYPLRDAATGEPASAFTLHLPVTYILTAPFSALADMITFDSARQDRVLVLYLLLAYWIYVVWRRQYRFVLFHTRAAKRDEWIRNLIAYSVYLAAVCLFLAWAILIPRPAARFKSADPDDLVIDFHSHTTYSWDGRRVLGKFTPEANMDWHRRMGFSASFITDHNTTTGAEEAKSLSRKQWRSTGYRSLQGEEISLHDTHIGILGNSRLINNVPYDKDLASVFRFLQDAPGRGVPVMNLPEYWLRHPQSRWEQFARKGAAGFEIVNAVPIALDFPREKRLEVIKLCREHHLFAFGVTDNHGWGNAAFVWNVMHIPGQAKMDPDRLQRNVLAKLRKDGADAVQVIVRTKHEPLGSVKLAIDPLLGLWTLIRTFSMAETLACILWTWLAMAAIIGLKTLVS